MKSAAVSKPAIRYHGAKFRLAPWITAHFPPHAIYVEPFGGAAGVLLQKAPSYAEVYNDLDDDVVNFFRVLRDAQQRTRLIDLIACTPYARVEFDAAWECSDEPVERARRLAIRAQMGFGSAGATKASTGMRIDTRRRHGTAQHDWLKFPEAIAAAGARLAGVLVENRPAIEVMLQHDSPQTLHYVDPPYVHATRCMKARSGYRHEMSDTDHVELIDVLKRLQGMVVLSGYLSGLYDDALNGWERRSTTARISAGRGAATRTEVVWLNCACVSALERNPGALFAEVEQQ